jgi:hypothetical protein
LDILFWSGAGILIGRDDPNNGSFPTLGSSFTSIADYSKTFELESIASLIKMAIRSTNGALRMSLQARSYSTARSDGSPVPFP